MYSRKIKQMKKKLLNSSSLTPDAKNSFFGNSSGGGGLNSNWGPRLALYEREQQRSREQELFQQQEIYNKSIANSTRSVFKNPYATSGIGIHTSNGFICKTNRKLLEKQGAGNELRLRSPSPDAGQGPSNARRNAVGSPPLTTKSNNDSLASTKTYHSSGGSSHSSNGSTASSRNSSIGRRSSLILGSDHNDEDDMGSYDIHGQSGSFDELGEGSNNYPGLISYKTQPSGKNSPCPNNVKLITVHHLNTNEFQAKAEAAAAQRNSNNPGAGYYSKNILRNNPAETGQLLSNTCSNRGSNSNSSSSKLMQGFTMVYVPMESTKCKQLPLPVEQAHQRRQLRIPSPQEESQKGLVSNGKGNTASDRETTTKDGAHGDIDSLLESFDSILFKPKKSASPSSMSSSSMSNKPLPPVPPHRDPTTIPNNADPKPNSSGQNGDIIYRKKTPPPLPPKNKPKSPAEMPTKNAGLSQSSQTKTSKNLRFSDHLDVKSPSPYTTMSYDVNNNIDSAPINLPSFSGHNSHNSENAGPRHQPKISLDEDGRLSTNTGPASRASIYSACTTTTTLLSCGHLRDSYSTLSSLNSRQFSEDEDDDEDDDDVAGSKESGKPQTTAGNGNCQDNEPISGETIEDVISNKSALQQLRDLSILIGGSFHTSPNLANAEGCRREEISKATAGNESTKMQLRKCSTETSNDSGKGSAGTGSERSRSGGGGSGPGSIMQLLQLPPVAVAVAPPAATSSSHVRRSKNSSADAKQDGSAHVHYHRQHSTSSCSCDSSMSSCLFQPDCEECQQVFRNPFEIPPELQYIESAKHRPKMKKVISSKKDVTRKNSIKLTRSKASSRSNKPILSISAPIIPPKPKPKTSSSSSSSLARCECEPYNSNPNTNNNSKLNRPKTPFNEVCTKTQFLLNKSAEARHVGCVGCLNEQLLNHSSCCPSMNPNLFTIDEAAEENDGTLLGASLKSTCRQQSADGMGNGTMVGKTKAKHKTKYGRTKKKGSKKVRDDKIYGHGQCWMATATDGTMGWSDLESMYSQNMRSTDSTLIGKSKSQESQDSGHNGGDGEYVNGECKTCWKELTQYKHNSCPESSNYTVERTKRMFIWLNRRPKEFNEPWWEAKKQASIKWLITKAYSHLPKGSVQHPFKESRKDKNKLCLKEQVMAGLLTGKLYCMALENLFQDCSFEEQKSIFGPAKNAEPKPKCSAAGGGGVDVGTSNGRTRQLTLSHWEIIKILSRKGIYVAQPSDMKLTEGTLRQKKPFRITAHIALIEAIMGLYAKVMLTRERIEPIVSNLGYHLAPDAQNSEEFLLAWINAVVDTLKSYVLSNIVRKLPSNASSSTHHRWLNILPMTDLRDLFDGIGICSLFALYFSNHLTLDQVSINEAKEPLSIYDSISNQNTIHKLSCSLFPQNVNHLRLTDFLYIHGYMKQNILQLLLDIFYFTEIVPIDEVSRLTHVPLRIQL